MKNFNNKFIKKIKAKILTTSRLYPTRQIDALKDEQNKVIMDWSPKAACTYAVTAFIKNMGIYSEAHGFKTIHKYRQAIFYDKYGRVTLDELKSNSYYKFKVVRNPFTRVVSSYFQSMKHKYLEVSDGLNKDFDSITFTDFIDYLETKNLTNCNSHYSLQKHWYEYKIKDLFDLIIKVEDLDKGFTKLQQQTDFKNLVESNLQHVRKTKTNQQINFVVADVPWFYIQLAKPEYKYFYTPQLIQKVASLYHDDLKEYGYTYDL